MWSNLDSIIVERPWALVGDFDYVLKVEERSSSTSVSSSSIDWDDSHCLMDLGYSGAKFTWVHGATCGAARFDRALCDEAWRTMFQSASVIHLPHNHSDHCPLLLTLMERDGGRLGNRPFHFLSGWFSNADFFSWMDKECRDD